ncbi:hypothetical protein E5676_scaffold562G00140 [Cucumis melo var. makuwa]|uniref:Uncharacterized protein n=1 Tax=Cucumis melo var. makuwa TaxID=1194695 RepID=A0A5D3BLP3_CUCMM|nr:hypothetical protein E5676_scaffold562G00140 [Cucumis melo var. makuwa]
MCASFGSTRLICASFGSTRLICAFYGTTRLLCRVRAQRGADRREAGRTREGHMDASGFLIASAMYFVRIFGLYVVDALFKVLDFGLRTISFPYNHLISRPSPSLFDSQSPFAVSSRRAATIDKSSVVVVVEVSQRVAPSQVATREVHREPTRAVRNSSRKPLPRVEPPPAATLFKTRATLSSCPYACEPPA